MLKGFLASTKTKFIFLQQEKSEHIFLYMFLRKQGYQVTNLSKKGINLQTLAFEKIELPPRLLRGAQQPGAPQKVFRVPKCFAAAPKYYLLGSYNIPQYGPHAQLVRG